MRIKVLQWNILYKEKIKNVLETIKELQPDIICLQEATQESPFNNYIDTIKFVADNLSFCHIFAPGQKFLPEGNITGNAIISRYPLKEIEIGILQKEKQDFNDETPEGRSYVKAKLILPENKQATIVTKHMTFTPFFRDNLEKTEENKKIIKFLKKERDPLIFTGDFNSPPSSNIVAELNKFMKHAGPDFNQKTWTTKLPFQYRGFEEKEFLKWRLDYIFVSKGIKIYSSKIIETRFSDHLPILAELEI